MSPVGIRGGEREQRALSVPGSGKLGGFREEAPEWSPEESEGAGDRVSKYTIYTIMTLYSISQ